jgi:hypothetical protein
MAGIGKKVSTRGSANADTPLAAITIASCRLGEVPKNSTADTSVFAWVPPNLLSSPFDQSQRNAGLRPPK